MKFAPLSYKMIVLLDSSIYDEYSDMAVNKVWVPTVVEWYIFKNT